MLGNLLLLRGNWFSLTELVLNHISSFSFLEEMLNSVREEGGNKNSSVVQRHPCKRTVSRGAVSVSKAVSCILGHFSCISGQKIFPEHKGSFCLVTVVNMLPCVVASNGDLICPHQLVYGGYFC